MLGEPAGGEAGDPAASDKPWWRHMTAFHWWVFAACALGWMFDCMDQRLFILARNHAMAEFLKLPAADPKVNEAGGQATAVFLIGWATGGLIFGALGDRWGRARVMLLTILMYSVFTGLSALSTGVWDFMLYRFLTGLGVGGEFAAGVSLLAESMPPAARAATLGSLQALSAVGNICGSLVAWAALPNWRLLFLIGILPALMAVLMRRRLKEPEGWSAAKRRADLGQERLGSLAELLGDPRWRFHAMIGVSFALAGVIGLWGVAFWTPEFNKGVLNREFRAEAGIAADAELDADQKAALGARVKNVIPLAMVCQDAGSFLGIYAFTLLASRMGRRAAFAFSFIAAYLVTAAYFGLVTTTAAIFPMSALLGFGVLSVFGGFAIYFTELFPTRLRSTGTGFCYNVARYLAALGPFTLGKLQRAIADNGIPAQDAFRYATLIVASVYLLGLATVWFAPETKGKPLPE